MALKRFNFDEIHFENSVVRSNDSIFFGAKSKLTTASHFIQKEFKSTPSEENSDNQIKKSTAAGRYINWVGYAEIKKESKLMLGTKSDLISRVKKWKTFGTMTRSATDPFRITTSVVNQRFVGKKDKQVPVTRVSYSKTWCLVTFDNSFYSWSEYLIDFYQTL